MTEFVRRWGDPEFVRIARDLDEAAARGVEHPAVKIMFSQNGTQYRLVVMRQVDADLIVNQIPVEEATQ